jgi:hypothetical protein
MLPTVWAAVSNPELVRRFPELSRRQTHLWLDVSQLTLEVPAQFASLVH